MTSAVAEKTSANQRYMVGENNQVRILLIKRYLIEFL